MNTPQTMMFTSQLLLFIQSRTFGMNCCARLWNSRKNNSGRAATSTDAAMKGNAATNPALFCTRITATVTGTRRFARKQDAWFRKDPRVHWVTWDDPEIVARAVASVRSVSEAGAGSEPLSRPSGRPQAPRS